MSNSIGRPPAAVVAAVTVISTARPGGDEPFDHRLERSATTLPVRPRFPETVTGPPASRHEDRVVVQSRRSPPGTRAYPAASAVDARSVANAMPGSTTTPATDQSRRHNQPPPSTERQRCALLMCIFRQRRYPTRLHRARGADRLMTNHPQPREHDVNRNQHEEDLRDPISSASATVAPPGAPPGAPTPAASMPAMSTSTTASVHHDEIARLPGRRGATATYEFVVRGHGRMSAAEARALCAPRCRSSHHPIACLAPEPYRGFVPLNHVFNCARPPVAGDGAAEPGFPPPAS